jgi:nucleotide-binding universal stress UspA family protein
MLVAVDTAPPVAVPPLPDWTETRERQGKALSELRDSIAPGARTVVESDSSVPRGLERVATREHRDLVVGSSHRARHGQVRIARRTRQLLGELRCALALAPRSLCAAGLGQLSTIGVGYDGSPEAREAVRVAGQLASAAGARLRLRAVADDRLPYVWWAPTSGPGVQEVWDALFEPDVGSLREDAERAVRATGADATVEVRPGDPPEELIALSGDVDLLVIGSRRWGAARLLLGCTGEELMHDAPCSVMVVPRPASSDPPRSEPRVAR